MTLEFVNHLRFGSILALGISRPWKDADFVIFPLAFRWAFPSLNIFRVFTFLAELQLISKASSQHLLFHVPVKVLALDFDIGHAIADFALADLAGRLFLASTHDEFPSSLVSLVVCC